LWMVQEAGGQDLTDLFAGQGLQTAVWDQYRLVWDPIRWVTCTTWAARLAETPWHHAGSKRPVYVEAQAAILFDKEAERTLEAWSYHMPPATQKDQAKGSYPHARYDAFIEALKSLGQAAEDTTADGWISAGDDNWDEDGPLEDGGGIQTDDLQSVMLGEAIGLRQVQAGTGTYRAREIDDYRIRRVTLGGMIRPTHEVQVRDGGGAEKPAHQIHEREWKWLYPEPATAQRVGG
jgi:hypothetical protein